MCTPSLAVNWLCTLAFEGFGRSVGTFEGHFVGVEWPGDGHGGGGEKVCTGAGAEAAGEAAPPEAHAVATAAVAAIARPREPQRRSMQCPSRFLGGESAERTRHRS